MSVSTRVLGLTLNQFDDTIGIAGLEGLVTLVVTKRDVLHTMAKMYIPLGLCSVITSEKKYFYRNCGSLTWFGINH